MTRSNRFAEKIIEVLEIWLSLLLVGVDLVRYLCMSLEIMYGYSKAAAQGGTLFASR